MSSNPFNAWEINPVYVLDLLYLLDTEGSFPLQKYNNVVFWRSKAMISTLKINNQIPIVSEHTEWIFKKPSSINKGCNTLTLLAVDKVYQAKAVKEN